MTEELHKIPFGAYKGDAPYLFVSYSHYDSEEVFKDLESLRSQGCRIWYDEGISPGEEWSEEIAEALEKSVVFIYYVSPHSADSKNCRDEAYFALDMGKPFIAIYLRETALPKGLKFRMNRIQAVMKYRLSDESYHRKLLEALAPFKIKEDAAAATHSHDDAEKLPNGDSTAHALPISNAPTSGKGRRRNIQTTGWRVGGFALLFLMLLITWKLISMQRISVGPTPTPNPSPTSTPVPPAPSDSKYRIIDGIRYGAEARDISSLLPEAASRARKLVTLAKDQGIDTIITDTYVSEGEQEWRYSLGRTRPGTIITKVRGGQGSHYKKIAFDIYPFVNDEPEFNNNALFKKLGEIGVSLGLLWGGNYTAIKDYPHFEYRE